MSNENFTCDLPYSSVRPYRQAPQIPHPGNYQAQIASSSGPYYGTQTTAAAAAPYGASEYQAQTYGQQRPSNGGADFNWYGNTMSNAHASRGPDSTGSDDMRQEKPGGGGRLNGQALYGGLSLGVYAYNSTLNYAPNQGGVYERPAGISNQGVLGGRARNEDFNVRIPYQPYTRSFEQSRVDSAGSNLSQQGVGVGRLASTDYASEMQSYVPSSQTALNSTTAANSYSSYPSSMVVLSGKRSDNVESMARHNTHNPFSSQYGFDRDQAPGLQSSQDPRNEGTPTPPPSAQVRNHRVAARKTPGQKTKTPPLQAKLPTSSLPCANASQHMDSAGPSPWSTTINLATTSQSEPQPKLGQRYNATQSSQSYRSHSLVSEDQSASSGFHAQIQEDKNSVASQDPLINLRPPSSPVPTTVDPSHVYNRYHEYQKQIEAADAEHTRLAALKAEQEAVEAAAAALASTNSISQNKIETRSQSENERKTEVDQQSEMQSHPAPNFNAPSNLISTERATNENISYGQSTAPDPQIQPLAADPQKLAAMEEEMRLMVKKMREYQTQDPQLFMHVWENVKKTQAPRPIQAQIRAREDVVNRSARSQKKHLPSPISIRAQQVPVSIPRSEPTSVIDTLVKLPRKRKSRSKAVLAEQVAQKSRRLSTKEGERVVADVAPTTSSHTRSGVNPQQQAQIGLPHINGEFQSRTRTSIQNPSLPLAQGRSKTSFLWPEEHRDAIANTAADVLNAIPENAGKKIAAIQILDMLGYNPSYIELCELIEGVGFKLDRARFAITLLAVIPAVNATSTEPAESMLPHISKKLAPSTKYLPVERSFPRVGEVSLSIESTTSAPRQESSPMAEAPSQTAAPPGHSERAQYNMRPSSGDLWSRGSYRKTRERVLENQNSPSSSGSQREPGRAKKHGLPLINDTSNDALNEQYSIGPALANVPNPGSQAKTQPTNHAALEVSANSRSDDRLVLALTGRAIRNENLVTPLASLNKANASDSFVESSSKLDSHSNQSAGRPSQGWHSWNLVPTPKTVNREVSGGAIIATPPKSPPTHRSKEMAARKRTFAEIIDLTSEDMPASVEDRPLTPSKVRRVGNTILQTADWYDGAQEPKTPDASSKHQPPVAVTTPRIPAHRPISSPISVPVSVPNPYKDFEDIVKPIERSATLRNSRYDPKTIARDILIATSRHPFQRGLNAHLEPLKARFTKVDDSSDLFSFRWDIVDPGGAPVGATNMSAPLEELQNKSSISARGSSSSQVLLNGVKLPIGRAPLRPTRGGGLMRGTGRPSLLQSKTMTPAQPSGLRFSSTAESNIAVVIESNASGISETGQSRIGRLTSIDSTLPARRRGRASKNLSATSQHIAPLPKRIGRPPKALSGGDRMQGSWARRKPGRPRIHPLVEPKPKGRPRKSDPKLVTPNFIPFLCEWKDCKAELHNLETLRRHVYSVHTKAQESGAIACRWSRCGLTRQVHDESTPNSTPTSTPEPKFVHEPHKFAGMQEFENHMEKAHLIPFAWHMGDGPRGSTLDGSESDASAYLNDAAGNQITPSVATQAVKGGNAKFNNARREAQQKRAYDPALESPVELATPSMRAKFFMGTEWKRIKAPPRAERGLR